MTRLLRPNLSQRFRFSDWENESCITFALRLARFVHALPAQATIDTDRLISLHHLMDAADWFLDYATELAQGTLRLLARAGVPWLEQITPAYYHPLVGYKPGTWLFDPALRLAPLLPGSFEEVAEDLFARMSAVYTETSKAHPAEHFRRTLYPDKQPDRPIQFLFSELAFRPIRWCGPSLHPPHEVEYMVCVDGYAPVAEVRGELENPAFEPDWADFHFILNEVPPPPVLAPPRKRTARTKADRLRWFRNHQKRVKAEYAKRIEGIQIQKGGKRKSKRRPAKQIGV